MKAPERVPGVHDGKDKDTALGAGFSQAAAGKAARAGNPALPEERREAPGRGTAKPAEQKPTATDKGGPNLPQGLGAARGARPPLSCGGKHISNEDPVAHGGVAHEDMGYGSHQLSVL